MADKKPEAKKRRIRNSETVRQKTEAASKVASEPKPRRVKQTIKTVGKPVTAARRIGGKEYYLPMPNNRFGRFMNKRRYFIPRYFRDSFKELKEVTWPDRKQTTQLTIAVFVFAITFGIFVTIVDYGLDRIFKRILIK